MNLKISKIKAESLLKKQIEKGKSLQEELKQCNSEDFLDKLNSRYSNWENFTEEVILKIFPTDKEKEEFSGSGLGITVMSAHFVNRVKETIDDIEGGVTKLEGLIERLELYEDNGGDKTHTEAVSKAEYKEDKVDQQDLLTEFKKITSWWPKIKEEFGVSKHEFGRKINFVKGEFKREVIFRDVEHAYALSKIGFCKPAVILAGSVMEELLRLYLKHKNVKVKKDTFSEYIVECEKRDFLKVAVHSLTTSVRHFRNLIHLEKESKKKDTISRATAAGAVTSIFTLVNDF